MAAARQEQASRLTRGKRESCSCVRSSLVSSVQKRLVRRGRRQAALARQTPRGCAAPKKRGDPPDRPARDRASVSPPDGGRPRTSGADTLRVCTVCDLFLDFSQNHHEPATYRGYKDFLQNFCEMFGTLLGRDLKPLHVTRWLDAHPGWKGSRRNAVIAIKRAFNWADAEGLLQPNPIKAAKKPPQRHRDRILTPEERQEILTAIRDQPFREFVLAMMETGARPGEVRKVTAAQVNLDLGVWIFKEHKTAKRTGKQRIIYLNAAMIELTRNLVEKYPEGPLFPRPHGTSWASRATASFAGSSDSGKSCRTSRA